MLVQINIQSKTQNDPPDLNSFSPHEEIIDNSDLIFADQNHPLLSSAYRVSKRWYIISNRSSSETVLYCNLSSKRGIRLILIDFQNFTWQDLSSSHATHFSWPNLEGASGISTLLCAIEIEMSQS